MVNGLDSFREKFRDYTDCYTVIGGAACDILMKDSNNNFRATKDIDMIILLEDRYIEFASVFWEYIKEGGYKCGWRQSDQRHFYRFTEPREGYPVMIELFSKKPDYHLEIDSGIIPIHIDNDTSSLSAILLNEDFYNFMIEGRKVVDGISILGAEYLIPFKMYAWMDLMKRKSEEQHVNERDLKKHKNDVFRLLQIVNIDDTVTTTGFVLENITRFLSKIKDENIQTQQLGLPFNKEEAIEMLRVLYGV